MTRPTAQLPLPFVISSEQATERPLLSWHCARTVRSVAAATGTSASVATPPTRATARARSEAAADRAAIEHMATPATAAIEDRGPVAQNVAMAGAAAGHALGEGRATRWRSRETQF